VLHRLRPDAELRELRQERGGLQRSGAVGQSFVFREVLLHDSIVP